MSGRGRLDGKNALVFGGAGRIGRTGAEAFLSEGASVLLVDRSEAALSKTMDDLDRRFPGRCRGLVLNIEDQEMAKRLARHCSEILGRVDVLLNVPAYISRAPFLEHSIEEVDKQWQANYRIVFMVSQEIARLMAGAKTGKIINVASMGGIKPEAGHVGHCSVKAAVIALTKVMALELAAYNIQVNAIAPGPTETRPFSSPYYTDNPEVLRAIESKTPAGRIGETKDHAGLLVFLASPESDWLTGQVIFSDGGLSLA